MHYRFFALSAALLAAACSSSSSNDGGDSGAPADASADASGDASTDASSTDAGADGAPADGAQACNALANIAPMVAISYVASAPPAAQGGTIADGTYTMTAATIYTGVGGPSGPAGDGQVTIQITGSTIQVVTSGAAPNHLTTTLMTSNTSFTRTDTCPDTMMQSGSYTATPTTFTVILPAGTFPDGGAKTLVEVFTKQ